MKSRIYVIKHGASLVCEGSKVIYYQDKEKEIKKEFPLKMLDSVHVFENCYIAMSATNAFLQRNIPVYYLNLQNNCIGKLQNVQNNNLECRLRQYEVCFDQNFRKQLAKKILLGKVKNSLNFLRRISRLDKIEIQEIIKIHNYLQSFEHKKNLEIEEMLGIEGFAAKLYFEGLGKIFQNYGFEFKKRTRRPPLDPVNAMLSFGYTLLASFVMNAVESSGLDSFVGFFHENGRNPALSLDMMEEFRAIFTDHIVISLIKNKAITQDDFVFDENGKYPVLLNDKARKKFIKKFEFRWMSKIADPHDGVSKEFYKIFHSQCDMLKKAIKSGNGDDYVSFSFR